MATEQTRTTEAGIFVRPRWRAARAALGGLVSFARTKPLGFVSALVILGMLVIAVFAPLLAPYDPTQPFVGGPHLAPSSEFWFGTDVNGRDVMSRAFYGARLSMYVGFVAVGLSVGIGTIIGLILVFIPALASSVTPMFLGGPNGASFGSVLGRQFSETGTLALGSAMGVVLFAVSGLVIYAMWRTVDLRRAGFTGKDA